MEASRNRTYQSCETLFNEINLDKDDAVYPAPPIDVKVVSPKKKSLDDNTKFLMEIIHQCLNDKYLMQLFDENSQSLLKTCMNLSNEQRSIQSLGSYLVCSLFWIKEEKHRVKELQKIVNDKHRAANVDFKQILDCILQNERFLTSANPGSFDEYYELLNGVEVKEVCQEFKLTFTNKEAAKSALQMFCNQNSISHFFGKPLQKQYERVMQSLRLKCGDCYKLSDEARKTFEEVYILMHLGIERTISSENKLEFIINTDNDNRDIRSIDNASVVFKNRHEFQSYLEADKLYQEFKEKSGTSLCLAIVEKAYKQYKDISKANMSSYMCLPVWLSQFTPAYVYLRILDSGVPVLKRQPEREQYCLGAVDILTAMVSQNLYRPHNKAEWYSEMALIYYNYLNDSNKAANIVVVACHELRFIPDYQLDCLRARASVLKKKSRIEAALADELSKCALRESLEEDFPATHIHKQPMEKIGDSDRRKLKFEYYAYMSAVAEIIEAEEYCKLYYIKQGIYTHGEHWEGTIITTIFTLLFWDIIYAELRGVKGIFVTRYQKYPLDMFTEAFYSNRKCLIETLLDDIEKKPMTDLLDTMKNVWEIRPTFELLNIQRDKTMTFEKVAAVCQCLGGPSLAAICRRLAMDFEYCHSGFPDLTLWNPHTNQIMFVEVKTDRDCPSLKQLQWMKYLQSNKIGTEFCYIGTKRSS